MDNFEIVKFYFELPNEQNKLDEMINLAQIGNYDFDVDYYFSSKSVIFGALFYIVFNK